jgi:hypothetical protein
MNSPYCRICQGSILSGQPMVEVWLTRGNLAVGNHVHWACIGEESTRCIYCRGPIDRTSEPGRNGQQLLTSTTGEKVLVPCHFTCAYPTMQEKE